jgi:RNA polymerase sigma-70 factor (ECF subfamily)
VNSALQRARATIAEIGPADSDPVRPMDEEQRALLDNYVDAFERYDLDDLVALLHDDVVQSMPPYELWLQGPDQVRSWFLGAGIGCRGSVVLPVGPANGMPAFGQYKPGTDGGYVPWSIHVLEISNGRIAGLNYFLDTDRLFPLFGLPLDYEG